MLSGTPVSAGLDTPPITDSSTHRRIMKIAHAEALSGLSKRGCGPQITVGCQVLDAETFTAACGSYNWAGGLMARTAFVYDSGMSASFIVTVWS